MRTLYVEGVAIRGGPESCVGVPRGRSEALTGGVRAGRLSRVIPLVQGADALPIGGRQHCWRRFCEPSADPARSENPGTYDKLHAREPGDLVVARELVMAPRPGWFAGWQISGMAGREGNAEAVIP